MVERSRARRDPVNAAEFEVLTYSAVLTSTGVQSRLGKIWNLDGNLCRNDGPFPT